MDLMPGRYAMLKESFHTRSQAMLEYASETEECRSRFLLRYFGQTESRDCGTCDVCRRKSSALAKGRNSEEYTRRKLIEFIDGKDGRYKIGEIVAEFDDPSKDYYYDYLRLLRQLIDDGTVPMYSD